MHIRADSHCTCLSAAFQCVGLYVIYAPHLSGIAALLSSAMSLQLSMSIVDFLKGTLLLGPGCMLVRYALVLVRLRRLQVGGLLPQGRRTPGKS